MTGAGGLSRSYGRLLYAYPRWYRRERGTEMLTTLLDAAAPGQRRPSRQDVADLVGGGLRCRLRPPRGLDYRVVAALAALFTAIGGLALAGALSSPAAPSEAEARAVAAAALPMSPREVAGPSAPCAWCPDWDRGPLQRSEYVGVGYEAAPGEVRGLMAQAQDRLASAGWQVEPTITENEHILRFDAVKGGTALSVTGDGWSSGTAGVSLNMLVTRRFSVASAVVLVAGFLGGLLGGWLLAAWALRRFQRHRFAVRAGMLITGVPALMMALLVTAQTALLGTFAVMSGDWSANYLRLPAFLLTAVPVLTAIAVVVVVATLAVAALPCCALDRRPVTSPAR